MRFHDLRFAIRALTKSWGFTLLAIASLGLGLGANTALFSLVDALLLRSLPVADPDRLVLIQRTSANGKKVAIDTAALEVIRGLADVYTDAALSTGLPSAVTIDGAPEPSRQVFAVTSAFFPTLGVKAETGRLMTTDTLAVAVISDRYWRTRFAANREVIGRSIDVDGTTYQIAGVAAPGFLGISLDSAGDIWLLPPQFRTGAPFAIARLRPGVSLEQATAATAAPLQHADEARAAVAAGQGPIVTTVVAGGQGTSNLRERYRVPLIALMALVALLLLVTCANLANLLVVRNVNRAHELHVRTALGAGRPRLIRQLLTEGLVLAAAGGALAWLCARQIVTLLLSTIPSPESAAQLALHADLRILSFLGFATLATVIGFALLPAWRASRVDVSSALKSAPGQSAPSGSRRLGLVMVGVQVALSVVLLTAAAMFAQTVRNVATLPLGFERRHLIEVELADRVLRLNAAQVQDVHDALLNAIRAVPGVEHIALSYPLFPSWAYGMDQPSGEAGMRVSAEYFATMKIPLRRGRLLTNDDLTRDDPVVVVNEWYARDQFPGEEALGKRGGFNNGLIVGVVGNANTTNVRWEEPAVYRLALPSEARLAPALAIRTAASIDPASLSRSIEQAVRGVNPRLFVAVRTTEDALNRSIARERMVAATSGLFGLTGLVLAAIGLFGVAASAVAHRTSELGLRIALGASRWNVVREALRGTAIVFAGGLAVGVVATVVAVRQLDHLIAGLLIGLSPADWMMVIVATGAMIIAAAVAAIVPALRAAHADPLTTIRAN